MCGSLMLLFCVIALLVHTHVRTCSISRTFTHVPDVAYGGIIPYTQSGMIIAPANYRLQLES